MFLYIEQLKHSQHDPDTIEVVLSFNASPTAYTKFTNLSRVSQGVHPEKSPKTDNLDSNT
jgi:hypothetical protein